jgi:hypothetical protein
MTAHRYELTERPGGGYRVTARRTDQAAEALTLLVPGDMPKGALIVQLGELLGAVCRDARYEERRHV